MNEQSDSAQIRFASTDLVRMAPGVHMWCQLSSFGILDASTEDGELLAALAAHARYRDNYGEPFEEQAAHDAHGPYRIGAITVTGFQPGTAASAITELHQWLREAIYPEHQDAIDQSERIIDTAVAPVLQQADSIYRLAVPREGNEHEWGWVIGRSGFHEFIAIDRARSILWLIVATDD